MTKENKEKLEEAGYFVECIDGNTAFTNIQEVFNNDGENDGELSCTIQELEEIKNNANKAIKILENLNKNLEEN